MNCKMFLLNSVFLKNPANWEEKLHNLIAGQIEFA